jgi:hypothetical protein
MTPLILAAIVFVAIFTQSVAGFGLALVSMPLLIEGLGARTAAPIIALVALTAEIVLLLRYRHALEFGVILRVLPGTLIGIPLGNLLLTSADQSLILLILGLVVIAYGIYGLLNFRLPEIHNPRWGSVFGFFGGILSGAYNMGGPPLVIYGTCRRWPPDVFKSNLQAYFIVSSMGVNLAHLVAGNYTTEVFEYFLIALPAVALGLLAGLSLDRFIDAVLFRRIVLVLLVLIGANLIL